MVEKHIVYDVRATRFPAGEIPCWAHGHMAGVSTGTAMGSHERAALGRLMRITRGRPHLADALLLNTMLCSLANGSDGEG